MEGASQTATMKRLQDQNARLQTELEAFENHVPSNPIVLEGLLEERRTGLGVMAGYKLMVAKLYHSGDFILAKAKSPDVLKATFPCLNLEHNPDLDP